MNDISLIRNGINRLLLGAFNTNKSLYILGSGASKRYSKMQPELINSIETKYISHGSYLLSNISENSLTNKLILPNLRNETDPFLLQIKKMMPEEFVKNLIVIEYARSHSLDLSRYNPEYQVFKKAKIFSTIIDMNHEGYALNYLKSHHYVIPLNGIANIKLAEYLKSHSSIFTLEVNFDKYHGIKTFPGEKQSPDIISNNDREHLNAIFPHLHWIVIIGYTFGRMGNDINDNTLFEFIKERTEHYKHIHIIIIDPNPEPVAILFEKELPRITLLPAYWDRLSSAIEAPPNIYKNLLDNVLHQYFSIDTNIIDYQGK